MKNKTFLELEKNIDKEAKRILPKVKKIYKEEKNLLKYINLKIKKEYRFFLCEIEIRILYFIILEEQKKTEDSQIRYKNSKKHLLKYYKFCSINFDNKNHLEISKNIAKDIVSFHNNNKMKNKNIINLVKKCLKKYCSEQFDSVDLRTVILFLDE